MLKLWTRPWKAEINKLLENLWVAPCSDNIWVEIFKGITLYSTNPSHCHEDSLVLGNYSHLRWLPWRKEPRGVTLEDFVGLGVYIWTQPSYSECLHLDPAHKGNLHWVFTFGPSPVAATPPTSSPVPQISSWCIKILNHFVCSSMLTIIKNKSTTRCSMGVYILTQPSCCILATRRKWRLKGKVQD